MDVERLLDGIRAGSRAQVARAITLVESTAPRHREAARELLTALADPDAPTATRVGISGVPGVGKSTFIEALGSRLTAEGHRVGVLAGGVRGAGVLGGGVPAGGVPCCCATEPTSQAASRVAGATNLNQRISASSLG